jgi:hypothetical protein
MKKTSLTVPLSFQDGRRPNILLILTDDQESHYSAFFILQICSTPSFTATMRLSWTCSNSEKYCIQKLATEKLFKRQFAKNNEEKII